MSKYFTPADFSDVESEIHKVEAVDTVVKEIVEIPLTDRIKIKESIEHEFDSCENGTSKLSKRPAVMFKNISPARNVLRNVIARPSAKDLNMLIFTTKEDYGQNVANWVCDKLSVIYPKSTLILAAIREGKINVTG